MGSSRVFVHEQMRQKHIARKVMVVTQKSNQLFAGACRLGIRHVDLRPVARGEHHRLRGRRAGGERLDGRAHVAAREVEALAQIDGRCSMTYAEEEEMHVRSAPRTCGSS